MAERSVEFCYLLSGTALVASRCIEGHAHILVQLPDHVVHASFHRKNSEIACMQQDIYTCYTQEDSEDLNL